MKIQNIKNTVSFKSGYPTNPWSGYSYYYPGVVPTQTDRTTGTLLKNVSFTGHSPVGGRFMTIA